MWCRCVWPLGRQKEVKREYNLDLIENEELEIEDYNAIVLAVAHNEFKTLEIKTDETKVVYDIKSILDLNSVDGRL